MRRAIQRLVLGAVGVVVTAAAISAQGAPTPGDASVTVDQQIHLGTNSAFIREGNLFLWGDGTNTGVGQNALSSSVGSSNTAVGSSALTANTVGSFNTAIGDAALQSNYSGERNTAVGAFTLNRNVSGSFNTAVGLAAMEYNTTGHDNTAIGHAALSSNLGYASPGGSEGSFNTAVGGWALQSNTYGSWNTAVGYGAMRLNTTGYSNSVFGYFSMHANETGYNNTAVGFRALQNNTSGTTNTAIGYRVLESNMTGNLNIAIGNAALRANLTGNENIAVGSGALYQNQYGLRNTAIGGDSLLSSSGTYNVGLGYGAGRNATTGNHNIFLLNNAEAADTNTMRIGTAFNDRGDSDPANDTGQARAFVAGIQEQLLTVSAQAVCVEATGQLGKCNLPSSRRYKQEIRDVGPVTQQLEALRPVTFLYREEIAGEEQALQFGLIAEEVAEVFPELVAFDDEGRPEAVKYRLLSSILLSEAQRQAAELNDLRARLRAVEKKLLE